MSLGREQMLKELELLPVWQSNSERPAVSAKVADVAAASAPAEIETPHGIKAEMPAQPLPVIKPAPDMLPESQPALFEPLVTEAPIAPSFDARADTIRSLDWLALQEDVPGCVACNLSQTRTQTVFGVGDPDADWLIIGEAPGAEEDRKGEPFVGMAGQLLDNMLAAIQLQRGKNVYIANVLKCRPPENRDPHGEEVRQCDPYLKRQVELIKPKLILALGKFAAQSLLESTDTIASMRGRQHSFQGVPVIVTYHPAYLLRNLPDKAKAWEDLCFARSTMLALQTAESPQ